MSRNDLCACGSGKRFKHCHGALVSGGQASGAPSALHLEALAVHRTGALRQAERLYRRALERDPADLDSAHMLGVVEFERMRYRDALEILWDACERSGWNDAVYRHNLGLVLAKLLTPQANERQEALVRDYMARERERRAAPVVPAQVSVVLTVRNAARVIDRALDSVAAQSYRNLELIVVDDGSSDPTPSLIARRLPSLGVPARLIQTLHRSEPRAANDGAASARGRYLAFLRGTEWFAPRRIERMVAEIARTAPLWGFSRVAYASGESSADGEVVARPGESFGSEPASFMFMIPNVLESDCNVFIGRELFGTIGGFRDVPDYGADLRERAANAIEPVIVPERLYFRDAHVDAAADQARDARADAELVRALASDATPANPFSPQHPANRDVLLRAALRAGRGDRIPAPMLRSFAARCLADTTIRPSRERPRPAGRRTAIVVLGPYRSGTSALARVLNLCGAFLPARIIAARLGINPRGFWETEAINDLNARLMQYLGADWNRVDFTLPDGGPLLEEFTLNSRDVLESEYADAPLILIKDPRVCVLAPLWHRTLEENGYRPVYVVCVRNPLEVARSLGNDMPTRFGLALWSDYMRAVETFVARPDVAAVHVHYADLLDDWRGVVRRIASALDVALAIESHATEVDAFLKASLRNHHASEAEFDEAAAAVDNRAVRELYRRMSAHCVREALDAG